MEELSHLTDNTDTEEIKETASPDNTNATSEPISAPEGSETAKADIEAIAPNEENTVKEGEDVSSENVDIESAEKSELHEDAYDTPEGEAIAVETELEEEASPEDETASRPNEEYSERSAVAHIPCKEKKEEASARRKIYSIFDFVELFIFTFVAVLVVTSFFFRHSIVDGPSMEKTLKHGEVLIISNFAYTPERGDIVVVEDYTTLLKKPIVKRVIALGGQTVKIDRRGVWVDGNFVQEPYAYTNGINYTYSTTPSEALRENPTLNVAPGLYYEFVVPEGELFIMGDHRNDSTDSRDIGTVREDAVLGKVVLRVWPEFGKVE